MAPKKIATVAAEELVPTKCVFEITQGMYKIKGGITMDPPAQVSSLIERIVALRPPNFVFGDDDAHTLQLVVGDKQTEELDLDYQFETAGNYKVVFPAPKAASYQITNPDAKPENPYQISRTGPVVTLRFKTSAAAAEVTDTMVLNYEMMSQKEVDKMKTQAAAAAKRAEAMEAQLKKQMTATTASSSSGAAVAATAEPDELLDESDVKPATKTKGKASK